MKVLGPKTAFPTWGSDTETENPQREFEFEGFDYRNCTELGKQTIGGHKQNLIHTRTQDKGVMTPQETEPDLPGSVRESLAEIWVDSGLPQGQGH